MKNEFQLIILGGICDTYNWIYLSNYFEREFKEAKEKSYSADCFFGSCLMVVKDMIKYYYVEVEEEKQIIENDLAYAYNDNYEDELIIEDDLINGKNENRSWKSKAKLCLQNLERIESGTYDVFFGDFKESFKYCLSLKDIYYIENSINEAYQKAMGSAKELPMALIDIFVKKDQYSLIMTLLATNDFVHPETFKWIDKFRSDKGTIITLIKILHIKNYFKADICLGNKEIQDISLNTFGVKISESHIKQYKPNLKKNIFDFIPIAPNVK